MPFRFVHTADIHLDSPLRSLALRNRELAELVGDATRQALVAIVDLCLDEQVDALVIAGDLYDGDQTSMKTARFLAQQMGRLHEAGVRVFKIRGNHDALSRITKQLIFPDTVKVFEGRADAVTVKANGFEVVFHGLSFSQPHAPESLLPKYRQPVGDAVNIGIMHTSLAGAPGHNAYAPCNLLSLEDHGFDYWALGHIHQRSQHGSARAIVMPGMPQGRDINEAGEKTVSLVTVRDDRSIDIEQRLTSIAQFERVGVDMSAATDWRDAVEAIEAALARARHDTRSEHLVARVRLNGTSPLGWRMRRDRDVLKAEVEQAAERIGRTWIETVEMDTATPRATPETLSADPVLELGELMRSEVLLSAGYREEMRDLARDLLADLPPESRGIGGDTPEAFEAFLDRITRDGAEEILSRLKADGTA